MASVFLSYSRNDDERAKQLESSLQARGLLSGVTNRVSTPVSAGRKKSVKLWRNRMLSSSSGHNIPRIHTSSTLNGRQLLP